MNRVLGDILLKCGWLSASILSGPLDKVFCLWTVVAKTFEVQHHLDQLVGGRRGQKAAKGALRQLVVLDSLASHLANRLHDIFKRVEISCRGGPSPEISEPEELDFPQWNKCRLVSAPFPQSY